MKEEWRSIVGYEGLYEVSNQGRVKSLTRMWRNGKRREEKMLKEFIYLGYVHVTLCKDGKQKQYRVHRLVAMAFIPNPENKDFVDHIDTDRKNNNVENLRWVTRQENQENPISLKKQKEAISRKVAQYDLNGNLINVFPSITEASKNTGCRIGAIQQVCCGHTYTLKGYIWRYDNEVDTVMDIVTKTRRCPTESHKVEAVVNGEVKHFDSMTKASKELNISRDILRRRNQLGSITWKIS